MAMNWAIGETARADWVSEDGGEHVKVRLVSDGGEKTGREQWRECKRKGGESMGGKEEGRYREGETERKPEYKTNRGRMVQWIWCSFTEQGTEARVPNGMKRSDRPKTGPNGETDNAFGQETEECEFVPAVASGPAKQAARCK
ncbi:hypothetical protein RB195_004928 [Necator americanus]|uniref:Uncharacterized protein n=1 Tax=Necator americanus TaxID=51031 RepID=A0ABR1BKD2_NECAM